MVQDDINTSTNRQNPLLQPSLLPYELPDYEHITDADVLPAFAEALQLVDAEIKAIISQDVRPTFENTLVALEKTGQDLSRVLGYFFSVASPDATPERLRIEAELVPQLAAYGDRLYLDEELYARISAINTDAVRDALAPEDQRLLERYVSAFLRHGAQLSASDKEQLKSINDKLARQQTAFGENLLNDTNARAVLITDEDELEGLDSSTRQSLRANAQEAGKEGWLITLGLPTVQPILAHLDRRDVRQRVYEASVARGAEVNEDLILDIVRLRAQRAQLLGYHNHAEYVLADETAGSLQSAQALIDDLVPGAVSNAHGEWKELLDISDTANCEAWDWPYLARQLREQRFALSEDQIKPYFRLNNVLENGVFYAARQLYGITAARRPDLRGYNEDVTVWEIRGDSGSGSGDHGVGSDRGDSAGGTDSAGGLDGAGGTDSAGGLDGAGASGSEDTEKHGQEIGLLLTDYYARPTKRGGAWMDSIIDQSTLLGHHAVVVNVLNVAPPQKGQEPLLTLDETTTLFHEFGHALHGLLSSVTYPLLSGTNVPRDFVEYPSQLNEMWALFPDVLSNYAVDENGQSIAPEVIQSLLAAQQYGEGFNTTEYLAASALDLAWHSLSVDEAEKVTNVSAFETAALEQSGLAVPGINPRYKSTYFQHIFGGGYSAGYYAYLWAEVLDADTVDWFKENGGLNRHNGQRFRDLVLSRGGSRDYMSAFRQLRGRDKSIEPLLKRRGLSGVSTREL